MNNFIINGVQVSEEQYNRIKNIPELSDDDIDYSDIPPLTDEELERMKENRRRRKKLEKLQRAS